MKVWQNGQERFCIKVDLQYASLANGAYVWALVVRVFIGVIVGGGIWFNEGVTEGTIVGETGGITGEGGWTTVVAVGTPGGTIGKGCLDLPNLDFIALEKVLLLILLLLLLEILLNFPSLLALLFVCSLGKQVLISIVNKIKVVISFIDSTIIIYSL